MCGLMNKRNDEKNNGFCFVQSQYNYCVCSCRFPSILNAPQWKLFWKFYAEIGNPFRWLKFTNKKNFLFNFRLVHPFNPGIAIHHQPSLYVPFTYLAYTQPQKWLHKTRTMNYLRDGFLRRLWAKELTESK